MKFLAVQFKDLKKNLSLIKLVLVNTLTMNKNSKKAINLEKIHF